MKKVLFSIFLVLTIAKTQAQYVNIPDSNFRNFLMLKYPSCFNSAKQLDTTCSDNSSEHQLNCSNKNIKDITGIKYFTALYTIICDSNQLTSLPAFPPYIDSFSFSHNNFSFLPDSGLTNDVLFADFSYNHLTRIPKERYSTSGTLNVSHNLIDSIDFTDYTGNNSGNFQIAYLDCSYNLLSGDLTGFPNTCRINCSHNNISSIFQGLSNEYYLDCSFNPSFKFFYFLYLSGANVSNDPFFNFLSPIGMPVNLESLICLNTNLYCLPLLPDSFKTLVIGNSNLTCLPNRPANLVVYDSNNNVINFPVCNPTNNSNQCGYYTSLQGFVYYDINSNGIYDTADVKKVNAKIVCSDGNSAFTNADGYYRIWDASLGTDTLKVIPPSFYSCTPSAIIHTIDPFTSYIYDTIALQANTIKDSLAINAFGTTKARAGKNLYYSVYLENVGSTNISPNIVLKYDATRLTFQNAGIPALANGDSIVINTSSIKPGQVKDFYIKFLVSTSVSIGDTIKYSASVSGGIANALSSGFSIVSGSFDPNDKQATPELSTTEVTQGKKIDYTIRFQNTGNDTAFHVVIADTLDSKLDHSSLQMIATSHKCKTTMKDNIVFFEMRNIMLPDSNVDKLGSSGFIRFSMQPKATVLAGDNIPNTAAIYFDYNKPVITNTAITQIKNPILPLNILSYELTVVNNTRKINHHWVTSNEINTQSFIIQESADGRIYKSVGEIAAKGYGNNTYNKELAISSNSNIVYYRILAKDKNGNYQFSEVKTINLKSITSGITVLSNPVGSELVFRVNDKSLLNTNVSLINSTGVVVKKFQISSLTQKIAVTNLPNGIYYLQTNSGIEKLVIGR